jgi:DNA-binding protein HU-beta
MRKSDLINKVSKDTGIIQTDVELVIDSVLSMIRESVANGAEVRLREFGVFKTRKRPAKVARNLGGKERGKRKKPEPLHLPECTVPHFKPSKQFLTAA